MIYAVYIQVVTEPNNKLTDGVYLSKWVLLPDWTWGTTIKELNELIRDMEEVADNE